MLARIKTKEHENLSDTNVDKVIKLLEAEVDPINKKEACSILNISYNTTRLGKIIQNYKDKVELSRRKRKENRGKPANNYEISVCVERFLNGDSISDIANSIFRPTNFVKEVIEKVGVPTKSKNKDRLYWTAEFVPEKCARDSFREGQVVWNTKRDAMCIVRYQEPTKDTSFNYYRVFVIEPIEETSPFFPQYQDFGGYYDGAYSYDLASLDHLKEYGVDIYKPYMASFKNWIK